MKFKHSGVLAICMVFILYGFAFAVDIVVIGYNVESGGADPNTVATRIAEIDGTDIWGFSEVQNQNWANIFEIAAEDGESADFKQILGNTGGGDRLLIIYKDDKFELLDSFELDDINIGGNVRAPLVAKFKEKSTGTEFFFMVNHLYRSRETRRHLQADLLNEWASQQQLPVIAVGDYNFDWSVPNGETDHDEGYDLMTANDAFFWVRPASLIKTHDSAHNSVLDFVFVSGLAKPWTQNSTILVKPGDFPDDHRTSDHRPVKGVFDLSATPSVSKADVLERIDALQNDLNELKELVEKMP